MKRVHEKEGEVSFVEDSEREDCIQCVEDSSDDGDDIVLSSRRRQQRLEPPGAPAKKRRRVLPWTEEGRVLWPLADPMTPPSGEEGSVSGDSDGEDDCGSFVVDDDSESVVEEESVSERFLARGALLEVRAAVEERIKRLQDRLVRLDEQLGLVAPAEEKAKKLGDDERSSSEGLAVVDERTCTTQRESWYATVYPWEDEEGKELGQYTAQGSKGSST